MLKPLRRIALLIAVALLALPAGAQAASRPLVTGLQDFDFTQAQFDHVKSSGAKVVKLVLPWRAIAPATPPPNFDPANPAEPSYDWEPYDSWVRAAVAMGLQPLVTVEQAPPFAERDKQGSAGTGNPDPVQFGLFAEALARRYSGSFAGLPRVTMFEAWNEPNAGFFLSPPRVNGRDYTPILYREMVNQFAAAVHRVHADNTVVAGAQFPFTLNRATGVTIGPYKFMREVLCLSDQLKAIPGCGPPVQFDVWSHHPYTSGGPTHKSGHPDSVSLGDLPRMNKLLKAALRQHRVIAKRPVQFWVTEFGWDTSPPDPKGVPLALHARWVSEALYRSWKAGVSLFVYYRLRDGPPTGGVQSGLWYRCVDGPACDQPKPSVQAFRFPFVAFRTQKKGSRVWGLTPGAVRGTVVIERARGKRWKRVRKLRTDSSGIFQGLVRGVRKGSLRARFGAQGEASVPFSLKRVRDRPFNPFGSTG